MFLVNLQVLLGEDDISRNTREIQVVRLARASSSCKWSYDTGCQDLFFLGVSQRIDVRVRFNGGGDDDIPLLCFASKLLARNRSPGVYIIKKIEVNPHCSTPRDRCGN